jgi:hypothetical protein
MNIDVSKGFELGCFHFQVLSGGEVDNELSSRGRHGECHDCLHILTVSSQFSPDQFHNTFLHELIEATNTLYCNDKITHDGITNLANGLSQALKSLGVNFRYGENHATKTSKV